jgi:hypothetical protein
MRILDAHRADTSIWSIGSSTGRWPALDVVTTSNEGAGLAGPERAVRQGLHRPDLGLGCCHCGEPCLSSGLRSGAAGAASGAHR